MRDLLSDDLYFGSSLQDLDDCAEQIVQNIIVDNDPIQLSAIARREYGNAKGQEKIGDMELAYFCAKISLLLVAIAGEVGYSATLGDEFECLEGFIGELDVSQVHERLRFTLHFRYNSRREKAVAASLLGMKTQLIDVLTTSQSLSSQISGSSQSNSTTQQLLRTAAEDLVVPGAAATAVRAVAIGSETTSAAITVQEVEVQDYSRQANQQDYENQANFGDRPGNRVQSPWKRTVSKRRWNDLYLGCSLEDLDNCAKLITSRYVNGKDAVTLDLLARVMLGNAIGQEEALQDLEMAYVYCKIGLGLYEAAGKIGDTGNLEDKFRCLSGFTVIPSLSETHERLSEALDRRYTLREGRAAAASELWPCQPATRLLTAFRMCPRSSYQVSDSTGSTGSPQIPQPASEYWVTLGTAATEHKNAQWIEETRLELHADRIPRQNWQYFAKHSRNECLPTDSVRSEAEVTLNADDSRTTLRAASLFTELLGLMSYNGMLVKEDAEPDLKDFVANLGKVVEKRKGAAEVAAIDKLAAKAFVVAVGELAASELLKQVVQTKDTDRTSQLSMTNQDHTGSSSLIDSGIEDEESVNSLAASRPSQNDADKKKDPGLVGIANLGNTCYMSSVLQCLSNTPKVSCIMEEIQGLKPDRKQTATAATAFEQMLRHIQCGFPPNLCKLKEELGKRKSGNIYASYLQQDAQELLAFLLGQLKEDLTIEPEANHGHVSQMAVQDSELRDEAAADKNVWTIVDKLFRGETTSTVTCCACHQCSSTTEAYLYLALEIPSNKSKCTLQECLQSYLRHEEIQDFMCSGCKKSVGAVKKIDICRLPPVLVICFKRFYRSSENFSKLDTFVDFPVDAFDMSSFAASASPSASEQPYSLVAVTNHSGNLGSGHYTAFCKNATKNSWYQFDDSKVEELKSDDVVNRGAYILFYSANSEQSITV